MTNGNEPPPLAGDSSGYSLLMLNTLNTSISNISTKMENLDKQNRDIRTELERGTNAIEETKREISSSIVRSVSISIGIVTAIGSIGAILGFGSVGDLKQSVDVRAAEIDASLKAVSSNIAQFSENFSNINNELLSQVQDLERNIEELRNTGNSISQDVVVLEASLKSIESGMSRVTEDIDETVGGLKSEIAALQAAVREITVSRGNPSSATSGSAYSGDTDGLLDEMRLALITNDITTLNRTVAIVGELQKNLDVFELGLLSMAATRVREYDLAISAAREGMRKLELLNLSSEELSGEKAALLLFQGSAFQNSGRIEEAINSYKQCLQLDPTSDACLNNLSSVTFSQGNFEKSCELLESALEISRDAPIANNLAICYLSAFLREQDSAKKASFATRAIEAAELNLKIVYESGSDREDEGNALLAKAVALALNDDPIEAQKILNRAFELNPSLALIASSGSISEMLEKFEEVARMIR